MKCHICRDAIQTGPVKCRECSKCMGKDIFFHSFHFDDADHRATPPHTRINVDYRVDTGSKDCEKILKFERSLLGVDALPKVFPIHAQDKPFISADLFCQLSYVRETTCKTFLEAIPFINDYLRMNASLESLLERLDLHLCETDVLILLFKYTDFDVHVSLIDQLCLFQRPIPIYFGIPNLNLTSVEYFLLKQDILYAFLKYYHQQIPFIISFGTQECHDQTTFINWLLQTSFDCYRESTTESAYQNQLVQMVLNHQCTLKEFDSDSKLSVQCHLFNFHGYHEWDKLPAFFIKHMDVIIIHVNISDLTSGNLNKLNWSAVTSSLKALYLVCVHGKNIDASSFRHFSEATRSKFGSSATANERLYIFSASSIKEKCARKLELIRKVKNVRVESDRLWLGIENDSFKTWIPLILTLAADDLFVRSKKHLEHFCKTLRQTARCDLLSNLLPLSHLNELQDKTDKSDEEKKKLEQLITDRNRNKSPFNQAHPILRCLIEFATVDGKGFYFEHLILLWNIALHATMTEKKPGPNESISTLRCLQMNRDIFIRELQLRSSGFTDWNGFQRMYEDTDVFSIALEQIYRTALDRGEHIELIDGISSTIHRDVFARVFSSQDIPNPYVIGIIGEQSSGKSFLMNKVFGTKVAEFETKCTNGIVLTHVRIAHHARVKDLIILDTEGLLDGTKKKGKNGADVFDRKIVLQIMARSHIVLINISCNVNKPIQQIFEIVVYGMKKLTISNKPKLCFIFRNHPIEMPNENLNTHVHETLKELRKICEASHCDMDSIINTEKALTFTFCSPFTNFRNGDKTINTYHPSFCETALDLRRKIIDELDLTSPFPSASEWINDTLDLWEEIQNNENLFDYQSVLQLTLEKELQQFCIEQLSQAETKLKNTVNEASTALRVFKNIQPEEILAILIRKIEDRHNTLELDILKQVDSFILRLKSKYKLQEFPGELLNDAQDNIKTSLTRYAKSQRYQAEQRLKRNDIEYQLHALPNQLLKRMRTGKICESAKDFEDSFELVTKKLRAELNDMLQEKDVVDRSKRWEQMLDMFISYSKIDQIGVRKFRQNMVDKELQQTIKEAVLHRDSFQMSQHQQGKNMFTASVVKLQQLNIMKRTAGNIPDQNNMLVQMFEFLKVQYGDLQRSEFVSVDYPSISDLAMHIVKNVQKALEKYKIEEQDTKNLWYSCYVIMLHIFWNMQVKKRCEQVLASFERDVRRYKTQVNLALQHAKTAEEQGTTLIHQIQTLIQNLKQVRIQTQFEQSLTEWKDYRPSIISKTCVKQLFESNDYEQMFDYLKSPENFVKQWLDKQFSKKYTDEVQRAVERLSKELRDEKQELLLLVQRLSHMHTIENSLTVDIFMQSFHDYLTTREHTAGSRDASLVPFLPDIDRNADIEVLMKIVNETANILQFSDEKFMSSAKELMTDSKTRSALFERFYERSKGCGITCPYCKQYCDNDDPQHTRHRCEYHLLWVFAGYRRVTSGEPSLVTCESNDAFTKWSIRYYEGEPDEYIPFPDHLARFNPTWNIVNRKLKLEDRLLKAYIALEEELAEFYRFSGRAPQELRNKFYRSTITPHCYAFLIGINYTNILDELCSIRTNNVALLQQQLKESSIACDENLTILIDQAATRQAILDNLRAIVARLTRRSTLIFYFFGHGGQTGNTSYIHTVNKEHLTLNEIADALSPATSQRILLLFDCCYLYGMGLDFSNLQFRSGVYIVCSSRPLQNSSQGGTTGFFTEHLLKGLKGDFQCHQTSCNECQTRRDNLKLAQIRKVSCSELVAYLSHAMTDRQHFTFTAINGSDFDISFLN